MRILSRYRTLQRERDQEIEKLIQKDKRDDVIADMSDQLVMITKKLNELERAH